ncbi:hypothetical protein BDQ12DRAFT_733879 [Crucibulum laeve]|uniref:BTB domain-containing protein n=1 Tax=Crucibulum laeve TaxID=68775 RepID=A0A5C3M5H6_9AGAR|nr:hypothetical protein BDQ12DRAFT_733879 [Crucibulum laeve]
MVRSLNDLSIGIRGEPWFDDGNIILVTQDAPTAFRLHRGVLARHSEIFQDMFAIPQPSSEVEMFEGCQVVRMYDNPSELSNLVKALYDGVKFRNTNIQDFFYLAGILRLSTKYFISHLRMASIQHLARTWSYTLKGHDEMVDKALSTPAIGDMTYPYVHPLHVLNLAREVNVNIVIPSTFYFLSIYPLAEIMQADHPKLKIEHPSKPSSTLSLTDIQLYTLMFQHRLQVIQDFVRQFCSEKATSRKCPYSTACARGFSRLVSQLNRSWSLRTGPLHYMRQAIKEVDHDSTICEACKTNFKEDVTHLRRKLWSELPVILGLPTWPELEVAELPP